MTVDLVSRTVTAGDIVAPFEVDDYTRWRLLEGLDDISLTLRHEQDVTEFETSPTGIQALHDGGLTRAARRRAQIPRKSPAGACRSGPRRTASGVFWRPAPLRHRHASAKTVDL